MNQRLTDIRRAQLDQLLAGGGAPKKADSEYTLMGAPRQENEHKPYPKTERMNLGVKAVKSGLDKLNRLIDTGPSVRDVLGNVVGAVPFVGPDLRKGMEDSTLTIPYEFQRSETNPRVATGVNTAKVPTTDILDALKMSDITGGTGASNLLGSVGKGYAPDAMDVLDTLGLGAAGYSAAKGAGKGALTAARAGERLAEKAVPKIMERGGIGAEMLGALGQNTQSRAVKQKGGNWVDSEVKRSIDKLNHDDFYHQSYIDSTKADLAEYEKNPNLHPESATEIARLRRDLAHMEHTNAFNKWVNTKVGSYIRNQMATPDDPVLKMLDVRAAKIEDDYQAGQKRLAKLDERIAQAEGSANTPEEINNLANLKRTRSQRAAEIESDRQLAMESILPKGKDYLTYDFPGKAERDMLDQLRGEAGFPIEGYGKSKPAKAWEASTDLAIRTKPAERFQNQAEKIADAKAAAAEYEKYSNVELPEKFKAYLDTTTLSDKDKKALLKKTPKTMMVDMVGDRAKSEALTNARDEKYFNSSIANFSMAEENPYLTKLPPETPVHTTEWLNDLGIDHILDVLKQDVASGAIKLEDLNKITMDQAIKRAGEYDFDMAKKARDAVAQSRLTMPVHKEYPEGYKWVQLTRPSEFQAESNAMGHSVKGYEPPRGHPDWTPESGNEGSPYYGHGGWEGIKSGRAKVYSLVDPSGKPHTTIEVLSEGITPEQRTYQVGILTQRLIDEGNTPEKAAAQANKIYPENETKQFITQIKGKGNARPSEKYDPYTQDFVKSGKWADVNSRDLPNTGLYSAKDVVNYVPEKFSMSRNARTLAIGRARAAGDLPDYMTRAEYEDMLLKHVPEDMWSAEKKKNAADDDELLRQLQPPETPDEPNMAGGGLLSKLGKAAKSARAAEELVPAAGRMKFADQPMGGLNIIKETGGNWLGGDVERQLKRLQMGDTVPKQDIERLKGLIDKEKRVTGKDATNDRAIRRMENELSDQARNNAMNAWIESNLTNYVKKQMGTAEDPVRKLAEQGILHMEPFGNVDAGRLTMKRRAGLGYPYQGVGESDKAKFWERSSDASIDPYPAGAYKHGSLDESILATNPWLQNVPDETMINSSKGLARELGFDHILDVLRQDVREGRIRPDQLNKVSMEQAVRRTHEYDQEMAKKMREAQAKVTEGMPVHKDYGDKGYKWIELTNPKNLPEGMETTVDKRYLRNQAGELVENPNYKLLEDALKYEGNTMGHCVGGYCPDVALGKSRIFSLRDVKGEPHVTVEVQPSKYTDVAREHRIKYLEELKSQNPNATWDDSGFAQWLDANGIERPPERIVQIKGKQNRAPKEEYLPFVQDFVKGGKWSDVDDLHNTGLRHTSDVFNNTERAFLKNKGVDLNPYIADDEIARYQELFKKTPPEEGMAGGGSVGLKNALNNLLRTDKPEAHMAGGGAMAKAVLKAAEAAKKVEHPLVFPRAVPKSLEDIRPIAQRIAEQMTGDFVRQHPNPKVSTNPAGKSRKQFEREKEIPMETRNLVPPADVPVLDYEKKMGNVLLGVPGDPTLGGVLEAGSLENVAKPTVELTRVGDVTPEHPVPLFGGPRYGNDERFWASNYGAAVPIQNRADKLSDLYESPVLGQYIKMAPDSGNFALHNLDALLAIQQPEKLSKAKMAKLNREIKAGSPKYGKFPGFVGFEDPIDVLLQSQLDSNLRKHIAETLTKPTITDELGLANGLDVVAAISHPELRNMEAGVSGFSIGELRPKSDLKMSLGEHPTYDTNIPGALIGQSKYPVPSEIAFPDTTAYARSRMTPGVQEFNMLKMLGPRERIDQQYIDEIKMYEELMKQYTGKKKGGLAQTKKVKRHGNTVPH